MNNVVTTHQLTKHYGPIKAVDKLTFSIPEKSVFGILGPNGSGKTTTLGMILDVIHPTSGTYSWFDNSSKKENLQRIGSILESPSFYPYLSAVDNLKIIAEIKNQGHENINEVLKITGIYDRRFSAFRTYSLGMKQRLALAAALLCQPLVLILDEPTNGLDPKGIAEIRDIILNIAREGRTIILASHLLDEVQKVCSHFAVLNKGNLIYTGLVNESREDQVIEVSSENPSELFALLKAFPSKLKIEAKGEFIILTLPSDTSVSDLSRYVFQNGMILTHITAQKRSLEAQFLEILKEKE